MSQGPGQATHGRLTSAHVMNGLRWNYTVAELMERRLKENQPRVVVLGNSYAGTNIDTSILAAELGIRQHQIQVFQF